MPLASRRWFRTRYVFPTPDGPGISSVFLARTQRRCQASRYGSVRPRLEGEVEARQRMPRGRAGEPKRNLEPSLLSLVELDVEEPVEERVRG